MINYIIKSSDFLKGGKALSPKINMEITVSYQTKNGFKTISGILKRITKTKTNKILGYLETVNGEEIVFPFYRNNVTLNNED